MSQASSDNAPLTVVLVHGAFADGSSWAGVIERLQKNGIQVTAPVNPLREVTDTVYEVADPRETLCDDGETTRLKSGGGGGAAAVVTLRLDAVVTRVGDRVRALPGDDEVALGIGSHRRVSLRVRRIGVYLELGAIGRDLRARDSILLGFDGDISVTANVAPEGMARMCAAALAGDAQTAAAIDADLAALHRALFVEPNPIPVKWALAELGLIDEGIRLPLVPLDPAFHDEVRAAIKAAGLM